MRSINVNADLLGGVTSLLSTGLELFAGDDKRKAEMILTEINNAHEANIAQTKINANEATNPSIFVSGWRPFIGWVCGVAVAFTFIVKPFIFPFLYEYYPSLALLPDVNESLFELVLGMLGLAGLRSFEKRAGIARR